jgi:ribosomal protein S18 acetylase RimI-like enzyme
VVKKRRTTTVVIRTLRPTDAGLLSRAAPGVFDREPQSQLSTEFLNDSRHHLVVALEAGQIVGFVSGVRYLHPDKPGELFIDEVGVAPTHRREGLGRRLVIEILALARRQGCRNAWVLTDRSNGPAMHLYQGLGGKESPTPQVMFEFSV